MCRTGSGPDAYALVSDVSRGRDTCSGATVMITGSELLALGILCAIAVWLLRLYFQPRADCRRCGGTGRNAFTRWFGGGRNGRTGPCGACGGSGKRFVLGAAALHRAIGRRKKKD